MINWFKQLDELLRGDRVRAQDLAHGRLGVSLRVFVPLAIVLGMSYGFFLGWYALGAKGVADPNAWKQLLASMVKLPMLFLFTLGVTFPSLYVFNALVGCRLDFKTTLRLLVAAIAVNLAVGASLGPILGFFTVSTESYAFMILLNVALLGVAGLVGLGFLLKALRGSARVQAQEEITASSEQDTPPSSPIAPPVVAGELATDEAWRRAAAQAARSERQMRAQTDREQSANVIFRVWVFIYALVGVQMGWVLRPFIGSPGADFAFFRPREGSFFLAVFQSVRHLVGW